MDNIVHFIEPFDVNKAGELDSWLERFELCCEARSINARKKVSHLFIAIGKEAYGTLRSLCYPQKPIDTDFDILVQHLREHYLPASFEALARAKFHSMIRLQGQSVRQFIAALQDEASHCDFTRDFDPQLRDRFVAGISNAQIQRWLLLTEKLDFTKAKQTATMMDDATMATDTHLSNSTPCLISCKSPSQMTPSRFSKSNRFQEKGVANSSPQSIKGICDSCGGNHLRKDCKFRQSICHRCHKKGHIKKYAELSYVR